jgi:hypothetical protein
MKGETSTGRRTRVLASTLVTYDTLEGQFFTTWHSGWPLGLCGAGDLACASKATSGVNLGGLTQALPATGCFWVCCSGQHEPRGSILPCRRNGLKAAHLVEAEDVLQSHHTLLFTSPLCWTMEEQPQSTDKRKANLLRGSSAQEPDTTLLAGVCNQLQWFTSW